MGSAALFKMLENSAVPLVNVLETVTLQLRPGLLAANPTDASLDALIPVLRTRCLSAM